MVAARVGGKKYAPLADPKLQIKIQVNGRQENGQRV
jgi:hypothetical protein